MKMSSSKSDLKNEILLCQKLNDRLSKLQSVYSTLKNEIDSINKSEKQICKEYNDTISKINISKRSIKELETRREKSISLNSIIQNYYVTLENNKKLIISKTRELKIKEHDLLSREFYIKQVKKHTTTVSYNNSKNKNSSLSVGKSEFIINKENINQNNVNIVNNNTNNSNLRIINNRDHINTNIINKSSVKKEIKPIVKKQLVVSLVNNFELKGIKKQKSLKKIINASKERVKPAETQESKSRSKSKDISKEKEERKNGSKNILNNEKPEKTSKPSKPSKEKIIKEENVIMKTQNEPITNIVEKPVKNTYNNSNNNSNNMDVINNNKEIKHDEIKLINNKQVTRSKEPIKNELNNKVNDKRIKNKILGNVMNNIKTINDKIENKSNNSLLNIPNNNNNNEPHVLEESNNDISELIQNDKPKDTKEIKEIKEEAPTTSLKSTSKNKNNKGNITFSEKVNENQTPILINNSIIERKIEDSTLTPEIIPKELPKETKTQINDFISSIINSKFEEKESNKIASLAISEKKESVKSNSINKEEVKKEVFIAKEIKDNTDNKDNKPDVIDSNLKLDIDKINNKNTIDTKEELFENKENIDIQTIDNKTNNEYPDSDEYEVKKVKKIIKTKKTVKKTKNTRYNKSNSLQDVIVKFNSSIFFKNNDDHKEFVDSSEDESPKKETVTTKNKSNTLIWPDVNKIYEKLTKPSKSSIIDDSSRKDLLIISNKNKDRKPVFNFKDQEDRNEKADVDIKSKEDIIDFNKKEDNDEKAINNKDDNNNKSKVNESAISFSQDIVNKSNLSKNDKSKNSVADNENEEEEKAVNVVNPEKYYSSDNYASEIENFKGLEKRLQKMVEESKNIEDGMRIVTENLNVMINTSSHNTTNN